MSSSLSLSRGKCQDSTPSALPELARATSNPHTNGPEARTWRGIVVAICSPCGFLVAIAHLVTHHFRHVFGSLLSLTDASLSPSSNSSAGGGSEDLHPWEPPITVPSVDGGEEQQPLAVLNPPSSVTKETPHPRFHKVPDGDDPADKDYTPPTVEECEPLDCDKPYENGHYSLGKADQEIVEQQRGSIISRVLSLRPRDVTEEGKLIISRLRSLRWREDNKL